jgi:hypothetical protein
MSERTSGERERAAEEKARKEWRFLLPSEPPPELTILCLESELQKDEITALKARVEELEVIGLRADVKTEADIPDWIPFDAERKETWPKEVGRYEATCDIGGELIVMILWWEQFEDWSCVSAYRKSPEPYKQEDGR